MKSRWLTIGVLAVLSLVGRAGAADRPNIVFLFADDQREDTIGAFGNAHVKTPNLDRLVREGFSFRNTYCAGSYSGAVCVASRSMLMTGRHWMNIPNGWEGVKTFPQLLGENGYTTFAVGKWHNGLPTLARSFQSGRCLYMGGMADHTKTTVSDLTGEGKLENKRVAETFSSAAFADAAIDFIKAQTSDKPFLLYVAFTAPHDPRNPPEKYRQMYYRDRPPLPKNFMEQHPFDTGMMAGRDESLAQWPRPTRWVSDQICEYYGLITHLDEQVGRIVEAIDQSKFADNTVVIYTADHGLAIGSHGLMGKQNVYDHSMKSPLIIRAAGVPAGGDSRALTYIHDLYPTILRLAEVDIPAGVDGIDLSTLWTGKSNRIRESVFLPFRDLMRAVRDDRWKLVYYPKINHVQLFDVIDDPLEMENLADNPKFAETKTRLTRVLKGWQFVYGDKLPLTSDKPQPKFKDMTGHARRLDVWQPKWIRDKYFGGRDDPDHGPGAKKKSPPQ